MQKTNIMEQKTQEQQIIELKKQNQKLKRTNILCAFFSGIIFLIMLYDYVIAGLF